MQYKFLDHVVVRVRDIAQAGKDYEKLLGIAPTSVAREVEGQGYVSTSFYLGDSGQMISLCQGIDATKQAGGAFINSLERLGEGLQNIAVAVDDVDASIEGAKERGVRILPSQHTHSFFLHPRDTHGVLIQIMQR